MRCLVLLVLLAVGSAALTAPALRTFTLKDHVGHAWTRELVHYALTCRPGECWPAGLRLTDAGGALVPTQLANVALHPDGSLASGQLWFIVPELPANGTVTYTLTGGAKSDRPAKYQSDLALVKGKQTAELTTSLAGVRVLLGSAQFTAPQPADRVPAPLQGIRLRSGAWTGRGWFETKHLCTGYTAVVTDDGPVFKQVAIHYTYAKPEGWGRADDLFYRMTVRLAAGQEAAYITEAYNLGDPKMYQPPYFGNERRELLWDWWSWRPHEAPDNMCFSLYGAFQPTHARTIPHTVSTPDKGKSVAFYSENEYSLQYAKDRFEFALNPWGRGEPDQSMVYTAFRGDDPNTDIISILPAMSSRWRHPDVLPHDPNFIAQHTDTTDLRVYTSAKPDLYVKAPLNLGRREWALAVLKNPGVITDEMRAGVIPALSRKYGALPLDKVKDWVLEWPQAAKYPHMFIDPGNIAGLRARIKSLPALEASLRKTQHLPADRYLLDGKDADALLAYEALIKETDGKIADTFAWPYGGERSGINAFPWHMMTNAAQTDVIFASLAITPAQRQALLARLAFLTYFVWDGEYMPPRKAGFGWGAAGMPTNVAGARGALAALLSDHPMTGVWVADSAKYLNYIISQYWGEDGTPFSCPHYSLGTEGGPVSAVLLALKSTGKLGDIRTSYPNLHNYGRFIVDMMTPVDIRFKQRILPTQGDTYWEGNSLSGQIAPLFKDADPELAGALMATWNDSGRSLEGFINAAYFFDPTIPAKAHAVTSVAYPGYGAFLRHGYGTPEESYLAIRFGTFTIGHMHNDAGSAHWYARGVPLSMDFGSMYTPHTGSPWWHSTLSYNHQERAQPVPCPGRDKDGCFYKGRNWYDHQFEPHTALAPITDQAAGYITEMSGVIAAFGAQPGADYVRGEANRRWFERLPYFYREQGSPSPWLQFTIFDKVELQHPFRWTRQFAFVKDASPSGPNYLVIADDLAGNRELEPAFNFWSLTKDVTQNGRQLYLTGQYGIDLDVFVLEPVAGRIQLGEWGHKQGFLGGGEENQKLVRLFAKPGEGFRVVLYPRKANEPMPAVETLGGGKLIKVTLPDQTHWLLLSASPITVSDGLVTLTGTAAVAKRRQNDRLELTLLAPGKITAGRAVLEAEHPATTTVEP
ncbi:MAG: hypothetical protein ACYC7E_23080 [Armatimonadota bacterium]